MNQLFPLKSLFVFLSHIYNLRREALKVSNVYDEFNDFLCPNIRVRISVLDIDLGLCFTT